LIIHVLNLIKEVSPIDISLNAMYTS
jgi:hypothetical protein